MKNYPRRATVLLKALYVGHLGSSQETDDFQTWKFPVHLGKTMISYYFPGVVPSRALGREGQFREDVGSKGEEKTIKEEREGSQEGFEVKSKLEIVPVMKLSVSSIKKDCLNDVMSRSMEQNMGDEDLMGLVAVGNNHKLSLCINNCLTSIPKALD